jgi:hypothetical protein
MLGLVASIARTPLSLSVFFFLYEKKCYSVFSFGPCDVILMGLGKIAQIIIVSSAVFVK